MRVSERMERAFDVVRPHDSLRDAARVLLGGDTLVLPVQEDGRLVGLLPLPERSKGDPRLGRLLREFAAESTIAA